MELKQTALCSHCRRVFRLARPGQSYCSPRCNKSARLHELARLSKQQDLLRSKHRRGQWAEQIACAWLYEHGYEVFRNCSSIGPIDIVAVKGVECLKIDVKLLVPDVIKRVGVDQGCARVPKKRLKPQQIAAGVIPLFVSPDGVCSFTLERLADIYSDVYKKVLDKEQGIM